LSRINKKINKKGMNMEKTLGELAKHVGGEVVGEPAIKIKAASTLEQAGEGDITFLANRKYVNMLETTGASAVVVGHKVKSSAALLIAQDPYFAFREIVVLLHGYRKHKKTGVSKKASIAPLAKIGRDCDIADFVTISDNVKIGDRCVLYPGVFVGEDTQIGDDCILYPNVVIYNNCVIGNRVIIQANATVGEDGYGFATHNGQHYKIPHIGRAVIEDDAEIGSGCGIERGTLDDTVIGKGAKLGDLVAIGHGTKVGPYCLLVAQVGISGSTTLGHHCVVGGQTGIAGHITIGNQVMIGAQAGVTKNIEDGAIILGAPAIDAGKAKRAYTLIAELPTMNKDIRKLQKKLEELEKNLIPKNNGG
jgi:UDP-3-O-[3-hydroxymyristoyl] glucosamine N-acyltransferase